MERPTLPPRRPVASATPDAQQKGKRSSSARPARAPRRAAPERRVDVRDWLARVRVSGFVVIMLGLVVLGTFVLVPTVGTYMDQRQQIQALQSAVKISQSEVEDLQMQRDRWSDPAYIRTQARERLGYTFPGEIVYLIDNDLPASSTPQEQDDVSDEVGQTRTDWMAQLVRSVAASGAAQVATPTIGVPDPTPASQTPAG
ncbi:cell division protein FtsB [Microbacterium sp. SORGH_AS 1204]|uniref:FtsB family cell division protein n=1 Tax=Microbacterium sp. SORGH_AS_1204 TaxID=3041785 RepID=UPI00278E0E47|nr:septum formation initiator family protein [Microbacterium sp. SORGH_AS_1204]MDQ1137149.1 cell division protein FtsB [Microbacterium sp. SORGH_AS_1204]